MKTARRKAVENHRTRLKQRGLVRVEVQVREADADLIRRTAQSLRGETRTVPRLRAELIRLIGASTSTGLKALLAAAPLEGIDLSRTHDRGRPVEL